MRLTRWLWKGTRVQYTGRLHRVHPGKTEIRMYDDADREVPMLVRMFDKRLPGYRAIGYARSSTPNGSGELDDKAATEDGDHPEPDDATT